MVFVEDMPLARAERAELPAEHGLADVAVRALPRAFTVQTLLGAVVDARDAERGGVQREDRQRQAAEAAGGKATFPLSLIHMIVVVHGRDDLVAKPDVGALADQQRITEEIE